MSRPAPQGSAAPDPASSPAATVVPERVVARVRRHARVLTVPVILLIAVAGVVGYTVVVVPELWQRLAIAGGAAVVVVLGTLLPFLSWLTHRWTLTTRRVIQRSGVFARSRQELQLHRANEVTVRRTPGQRMFGSGDVRVATAHERPLILRDVPKPLLVQAALDELIDRSHRDAAAERRIDPPDTELDTVIWGSR